MPKKVKIDDETLKKWARTRSFEDIENELKIKTVTTRSLKRMGYPASKYYKVVTKKDLEKNRKKTEEFLEKIEAD